MPQFQQPPPPDWAGVRPSPGAGTTERQQGHDIGARGRNPSAAFRLTDTAAPETGPLRALTMLYLLAGVLFASSLAHAQPKAELRSTPTIAPAEGERLATKLIAELLAQKPESSTNTGTLKIRARGGSTKEVTVRFEVLVTPTNCSALYEVPGGATEPTRLEVIHADDAPNRYLVSGASPAATNTPNTPPKELAPNETMVPFAGSDFWIADLGLEFLHWPKQRVLRKELRLSQSCDVLESLNPQAPSGGYTRVVSWIDMNNGGIVHADAYDAQNELIKQFAPTELKTIHGQKQVEAIEMRNRRTGSRTWIKFNLGEPTR